MENSLIPLVTEVTQEQWEGIYLKATPGGPVSKLAAKNMLVEVFDLEELLNTFYSSASTLEERMLSLRHISKIEAAHIDLEIWLKTYYRAIADFRLRDLCIKKISQKEAIFKQWETIYCNPKSGRDLQEICVQKMAQSI